MFPVLVMFVAWFGNFQIFSIFKLTKRGIGACGVWKIKWAASEQSIEIDFFFLNM